MTVLRAQAGAAETPLHRLDFLEGVWTGEIDGTIGPADGRRSYRFVLGDRFLHMTHDRDPKERAPSEEAHEEWSIFSHDSERGVITLREFLVEGLVNTYRCALDEGPTSLVCESEATEGSSGLSLWLQYEFGDPDRFTETFRIFGPDGALQVQMVGEWRRTADGR